MRGTVVTLIVSILLAVFALVAWSAMDTYNTDRALAPPANFAIPLLLISGLLASIAIIVELFSIRPAILAARLSDHNPPEISNLKSEIAPPVAAPTLPDSASQAATKPGPPGLAVRDLRSTVGDDRGLAKGRKNK